MPSFLVSVVVAFAFSSLSYASVYVTGFWKNDPNRTLEVSR